MVKPMKLLLNPMEAGGGSLAPFLLNTYEMVYDSDTGDIVSWTTQNNSFVVWNPPEFAHLLLPPAYFKDNNFSSSSATSTPIFGGRAIGTFAFSLLGKIQIEELTDRVAKMGQRQDGAIKKPAFC